MTTQTATLCCELCETAMTPHGGASSPERYHHCATCGRWVASTYREELVRGRTARVVATEPPPAAKLEFDKVKERMARWMSALEESDPYRTLGLAPSSSDDAIRARYRELALAHHPDRGGDPVAMRRVIEAWDRIRRAKRLAS